MATRIEAIEADRYPLYDGIANSFWVTSILRAEAIDGGLGGMRLIEEAVATPYLKYYGAPGEDGPTAWAREFNIERWGLFLALDGEAPLGGAAVALDTAVYPMDHFQRKDLAVLWDIRVGPEWRQKGIGEMLFRHAAAWARGLGYGQLGLETQSTNIAACRFYVRMGCTLGAIHRYGYAGVPEVAHEAMLLWYLEL